MYKYMNDLKMNFPSCFMQLFFQYHLHVIENILKVIKSNEIVY